MVGFECRVHSQFVPVWSSGVPVRPGVKFAFPKGPWQKEGNHEVLRSAARELFDVLQHDCPLFDLFFDDICDDLGDNPLDKGSTDHYKRVWEVCRLKLTTTGTGHTPKNSRWWSVETLARAHRSMRSMTAMLLVYIGFKRKWWQTFDQCPLFADVLGDLQEGDNPDPAGLEAIEEEAPDACGVLEGGGQTHGPAHVLGTGPRGDATTTGEMRELDAVCLPSFVPEEDAPSLRRHGVLVSPIGGEIR